MINVCIDQLDGIVAEESLRESSRIMVGTGSVSADDSERIQKGWLDLVRAHQPVAPATAAMLAGIGISVTRESEPVSYGG